MHIDIHIGHFTGYVQCVFIIWAHGELQRLFSKFTFSLDYQFCKLYDYLKAENCIKRLLIGQDDYLFTLFCFCHVGVEEQNVMLHGILYQAYKP